MKPLNTFVYDMVHVTEKDRAIIRALVADYNHANSMNFLALSVARRVLRGEYRGERAALPGTSAGRSKARPDLPRLLGLNELDASLHSLIVEFDKLGRNTPNPAIPSLYRHLGHWPTYLALAYIALRPLHHDGSLRAEQEQLITRSQDLIARNLEPLIQNVPPFPAGSDGASILTGVESVITGRMTVMGSALLGLLPEL